MSCASCHLQELAFTDGRPQGIGSTGEVHPRSSMSLVNVGYVSTLTWSNPLMTSLEYQALLPMFGRSPVELGMADQEDELFRRLAESGVPGCNTRHFVAAYYTGARIVSADSHFGKCAI
jgi:cytochrome c peroxidase